MADNRKRYEAIENGKKAERARDEVTQNDEFEVTSKQLEILTEILTKAPRSTVINFGVTPDAVRFIEKAEKVLDKLHELAFGNQNQQDAHASMLLRVFRSLEGKIAELSHKVDNLEKVKTSQKQGSKNLNSELTQTNELNTSPLSHIKRKRNYWTQEELQYLKQAMDKVEVGLTIRDFQEVAQQTGRSRDSVSAKYYELLKKEGSKDA